MLNKPVGVLSQKAQPQDVSAVEYLISYLLESGQLTGEELQRFHPSVSQSPGPEYKWDIDCRKKSAGSAADERIAA